MGYLGRQAVAQTTGSGDKKLLFIFQRGGNDGVNTIIPHGDSFYNTTERPTLYISPTAALPLGVPGTTPAPGSTFASLHPMMQAMMPMYDQGDLAMIHRVGYVNQSRSHFDSQDYWEKGVPRDPNINDGMFYRQAPRDARSQ